MRKDVLITWFLTMTQTFVLASACKPGWFGSSCQYKCRCTNHLCTTDGECPDGDQCEQMWFGPACQYEDLVRVGQVRTTPPTKLDIVTDGSDRTCLTNITSLELVWNTSYPFTWLRITGLYAVVMPGYHVTFKDSKNSTVNCTDQRNNRVNSRTADIFCDLNVTVQEIHIAGAKGEAMDVCSFYVSGGQNVALKQNATQSGVWKEHNIAHAALLAVDGNRDNDLSQGSCAHTDVPGSPRWQVTLARPSRVNRYVIYNRKRDAGTPKEWPSSRLTGFILKSFSQDDGQVFEYRDQSGVAKYVYTVVSASTAPVSKVEITGVGKGYDGFLELCEVEVYGEPACEQGWYGLNCSLKYLSAKWDLPLNVPAENETTGCLANLVTGVKTDSTSVPVVYIYAVGGVAGFLLVIILALVLTVTISRRKTSQSHETRKANNPVEDYCSYNGEAHDNHDYLASTENIDVCEGDQDIYSNPAENIFGDNPKAVNISNQLTVKRKTKNESSNSPMSYTQLLKSSHDGAYKQVSPASSGFKMDDALILPEDEVDDQNIYEN
ncbi:unnamed protein product [Lymnaea stagnalis]|uniref:Fucolectin tachylectin-4 pentraxin-1 domain-containing protein n=1 Tax=Lymnaea stagnalis TaxID=6523 RepID=A0AAV2HTF6_LYMST